MHEILVNRLGGLSLPRKSVVRLTDRPDMTLDVYRGRKTRIQPKKKTHILNLPTPMFQRVLESVKISVLTLLNLVFFFFFFSFCRLFS